MKFTKLIIAAILPVSICVCSCDDEESVDSTNLGRTVEFPEMSAQERGYNNGEILGKALLSMCDTIASMKAKNIPSDSPIFAGMLTSPYSKLQRPYVLYQENKADSLWMLGFKEGFGTLAGVVADSESYNMIFEALEKVNFDTIDYPYNSNLALQMGDIIAKNKK